MLFFLASILLYFKLLFTKNYYSLNKLKLKHNNIQQQIKLKKSFVDDFSKYLTNNEATPIKIFHNHEANNLSSLRYQLIVKQKNNSIFPNPEYSELLKFTKLTNLKQNETIDNNALIDASVSIDNLILSPVKNNELRIFIIGDLNINKTLKIEEIENSRIEIITVGNIFINEVSSNEASNSQILLYSAKGHIAINSNNLNFCKNEQTTKQLLSQLIAHKIKLSSNEQNKLKIGCSLSRNPKFWPNLQIIGERYYYEQ